jgi:hypothetical protein
VGINILFVKLFVFVLRLGKKDGWKHSVTLQRDCCHHKVAVLLHCFGKPLAPASDLHHFGHELEKSLPVCHLFG